MAESDPTVGNALQLQVRLSATERGHVHRSQLLDAFATLEEALIEIVERAGGRIDGCGPLAAKLVTLKAVATKFKDPKKVYKAIERIEPLNAVRGSLVHSRLESGQLNDANEIWTFRNVARPSPGGQWMCGSDFDDMKHQLSMLANHLRQLPLKPAPTRPAATSATPAKH